MLSRISFHVLYGRSSSRLTHDQSSKQKVENSNLEEHLPPIVTMVDNRTMAELLRAPIEGYAEAIVVPSILAEQFELKHSLINMMTTDQFFGLEKDNPHDHIHQDSLNVAAGGNLLERSTQDVLTIIENKSKQTSAVTTAMTAMLKQFQGTPPLASVKGVEESCVTCGGAHPYYQCLAASGNTFPEFGDNIQGYVLAAPTSLSNQTNKIKNMMASLLQMSTASTSSSGTLPSNTVANPKGDLKAITTRSGVSYDGPSTPPPAVENDTEATKDTVNPTNNENTEDVQPQAVQSKPVTSEPANTPVSASKPIPKASIPYPSRINDETLIGNKEKLSEMARTPLNEHCSAVLLKKLPEKLGDPGKFLIPCDFLGMAKCLALADLDASINLMPYYVWKRLSLPKLTPTCMTLELADRSISRPVGIAKDVYVKVGELTLRVGKEVITFNLDQTLRFSANYNDMTAKRIDMACEEYSQDVLGFSDTISSGNPTPCYDPIISATSPTLTPFENKGDILLLEAFLNNDPSSPPPNQRNYLPEVSKELKICEAKTDKSSVDEPHVVELKVLPPHLEYAFLKGDDKLPVIIIKELSVKEKTALITEKRHFMVKEGIVLGHKIFEKRIEVDKAKVDVISKLPHRTTVKGIRSFLGHASFYRRFIKDFSKIARPMTRLLKKDTSFIFSQECVDAFQTLKRMLTEALILIASDWDMPFELMCDASDFAIGAVLGQRRDKHFRPIHYASKTMTEAESKYTTTEKEMLAMVYAFEKFRSYLILNKSTVYTDHSTLKYLFSKKESKARLLRWVLLL
nr:reverse transcriptase domain-containing protein [Tanacetum cinerariifolium]